jgi:hypothetical protein
MSLLLNRKRDAAPNAGWIEFELHFAVEVHGEGTLN